jgi:GH24 family phage-related lysozyme (muramidase)
MNRENAINIASEHIRKHEGLSSKDPYKNILFSKIVPTSDSTLVYAYPDGKGFSIGWGSYDTLSDGTKVVRGLSITKKRADYELNYKLREIEKNVFPQVKRVLTDTQYAALLDTAYNAGAGALKYKGLIDAVNAGSDTTNIFPTVSITDSGTGKVLPVLIKRREDAAKLFNGFYDTFYKVKKAVSDNKGKLLILGLGLVLVSVSFYLYNKNK